MIGAEAVDDFLRVRADEGDIPGAVWGISGPAGIIAEGAVGRAAILPKPEPARPDTIYDLGSLTKPLITSFLFLKIGRELGLDLDAPVTRFIPQVERLDKRGITLRHLLTHASGLPSWRPLYARGSSLDEYLLQIRDIEPTTPPGTRVEYSCLDYIMLGAVFERCSGSPLDRLAREVILDALGLTNTCFRPPLAWRDRVAPTEDSCEYERNLAASMGIEDTGARPGVIRGEVHDRNAWGLGGVAGNAGLFSTAGETITLAVEFLGAGRGLLDEEALRFATGDQTDGLNESRSLAFRIALRGETSAGPALPIESFGHTGFPGTSVWLDPRRRRVYVLLTNRVHPRVVEGFDMADLRRRFHSLAASIEG